jgi:hypothetical protein
VGLQRFAEYFRYTLLDHDFLTDRELTEEMEFLMAVNPDLTLVKHIRRLPLSQMFLMCSIAVRFITENKPFEMRYIERFVRSSSGFALALALGFRSSCLDFWCGFGHVRARAVA